MIKLEYIGIQIIQNQMFIEHKLNKEEVKNLWEDENGK
jgi:hypothetical protein